MGFCLCGVLLGRKDRFFYVLKKCLVYGGLLNVRVIESSMREEGVVNLENNKYVRDC